MHAGRRPPMVSSACMSMDASPPMSPALIPTIQVLSTSNTACIVPSYHDTKVFMASQTCRPKLPYSAQFVKVRQWAVFDSKDVHRTPPRSLRPLDLLSELRAQPSCPPLPSCPRRHIRPSRHRPHSLQ